ncbi:hypothetical protein BU16DRAFT_560402 [Lophium mytilinum]|uniref:Uncharacterized protein n=1 Tax=Lophium mytilinum TaxID=390894 RepID=A0A6A6QXZ3_9PEZI|nr:hypothetical protein BU16DRAFT_560402 [Lophium mytilinum]
MDARSARFKEMKPQLRPSSTIKSVVLSVPHVPKCSNHSMNNINQLHSTDMLPKSGLSTKAHWSRIFLELEETTEFEETTPITSWPSPTTRASNTTRASQRARASRTPPWVTLLDRGLLLAALAKKRLELELLRSETQYRSTVDPKPPEEPICPIIIMTLLAAYVLGDLGAVIFIIVLFHVPILICGLCACLIRLLRPKQQVSHDNVDRENDMEQEEEKNSAKAWRLSTEHWERRLQWEAAWYWIERQPDYYANHFVAWDRNPTGTNTVIWEELVRLWRECDELE